MTMMAHEASSWIFINERTFITRYPHTCINYIAVLCVILVISHLGIIPTAYGALCHCKLQPHWKNLENGIITFCNYSHLV